MLLLLLTACGIHEPEKQPSAEPVVAPKEIPPSSVEPGPAPSQAPPSPVPAPRLGDAEAVEEIRRVLAAGDVARCREEAPGATGRVHMGWTIVDGAATDVTVVENTTGSDALARCVTGEIASWRFHAGIPDLPVRKSWTFR